MSNYLRHRAFLDEACNEAFLAPLAALTLEPASALLVGANPAVVTTALKQRYPNCRWVEANLEDCQPRKLPLPNFDLIVSSLYLHWASDPLACLPMLRRLLRENGVFLFSVFGAGSFVEYRRQLQLWQWEAPLPALIDLHHWGDALLEAGFDAPVVGSELIELEYAAPRYAWREARRLAGAPQAPPGQLRSALKELEGAAWRHNSVELVYAHAFAASTLPPGFIPIVAA